MTTDKHKCQGKTRDLATIPHQEITEAVDKIKRTREKRIAVREEMRRQAELERPKLAKAQPYLMFFGILGALAFFFVVLWIITQINLTNQVPV